MRITITIEIANAGDSPPKVEVTQEVPPPDLDHCAWVARRLADWLKSQGRGATARLASSLQVSSATVSRWAYLIAFHACCHAFRRVQYDDGKGLLLTVAAHG